MIEITNRFRVMVAECTTENSDEVRVFESPVYAISGDEKKFLVYDPGDTEHRSGFRWIDFTREAVDISINP